MKNLFNFLMIVILSTSIFNNANAQCGEVSPNCIQNGGLVGPTGPGNMNSNAATTIPNWFVASGTPSASPGEVWMWSFGGSGEGIYTCYNFQANHNYRICIDVKVGGTNSNTLGQFELTAANGLLVNGPPIPTTSNNFYNVNHTNTVYTSIGVPFSPGTSSYSQLWIRPFYTASPGTQYAVYVRNIHIEDLTIPTFTPTITASGPFQNGVPVTLTANGGPPGTVYSWSNSATGNSITVTPNCNTTQTFSVFGTYFNCPPPTPAACGRRSNVSNTLSILATDCCSDTCYWKVSGNNIIGTNNIFGTLTNHDVRINTNNQYRGIIDRFGHWGMGTTAGFLPDAMQQIHRTDLGDKHLYITGVSPSIRFYGAQTVPNTTPNTGPKIGLATGANNFTDFSAVGDFVIENTNKANIIFGTNWTGTNSLERMKVNMDGEVGINTVNSTLKDPTAFLHVNCVGNNTSAGLSDVRFENLEAGQGKVLVINPNGYVMNSGITLPSVFGNVNSTCTTGNFIPKVATGGSPDLTCSQVFDNGTNVGVGTTAPGAKLTILNNTGIIATWNRHNLASSFVGLASHSTSNNDNRAIGATGWASGANTTTSKIGVWGVANANSCSGNNVGVYGQVNSTVGFCGTHFAGYFAGQTLTGGPALIISDEKLKMNIKSMDNAMEIINQLQPRTYDFNPDVNSGFALTPNHQYGFISQEVETVLPDVVQEINGPSTIDEDGRVKESDEKYKAMNYDALISILVKAVQEQNSRINDLETLITNCCNANATTKTTNREAIKVIDIKISDKNAIVLNQNVPNPFAESTSITYHIPEYFTKAQIIFTNMSGQLIKVLDIKEMGKGQINVFADDLTSGQYTYTLVVDGKTIETKKMIKQ
jgi:hypothetical protein